MPTKTITREQLRNGQFCYRVDGEVHTAKSNRLYTHASAYRLEQLSSWDTARGRTVGDTVVYLHARADLAAKGNPDADRIVRGGHWSRVPGVFEIQDSPHTNTTKEGAMPEGTTAEAVKPKKDPKVRLTNSQRRALVKLAKAGRRGVKTEGMTAQSRHPFDYFVESGLATLEGDKFCVTDAGKARAKDIDATKYATKKGDTAETAAVTA